MKVQLGTIAVWMGLIALAVAQPPEPGGVAPAGGLAAGEYGTGPGGPPPNAMFRALDADGDGAISIRELRKAVVALKKLDADKDGKITQAEAMGGPGDPAGDASAAVDRLMQNDKNGDGKLSKNEIPRHLAQMLVGADTNGDGTLDRAELTAAMQGARPQFAGAGSSFGGPNGFGGTAGGDPRPGGPNLLQFDRNGDGQLSADEVPMQMMGLVRGADQNHNGKLDVQELQAIQQRMNERVRGQRPLPPGISVGPQGVSGAPQNP